MGSIENKCFTRKIYNLGKTRVLTNNKTKKKIKNQLLEHPYKYFSFKELYDLNCESSNDIVLPSFNKNPGKQNIDKEELHLMNQLKKEAIEKVKMKKIKKIMKQIADETVQHKTYLEYNNHYHIYKNKGNQYNNYYLKQDCNSFELLDIDKLSKGFDFFNIQNIEYNLSMSKVSFCVDFVGNRNFYFFIKDLINNKIEYVDLNLGKNERFISVHDFLGEQNLPIQMSDNYYWVGDISILYISYDNYFNTNKCYVYNLETKKRRLIYNETKYRMLGLSGTHSNYYYILYSSSYSDDEIYILDINEEKLNSKSKKVILNKEPIFKAKKFVKYEYINHIDGTWYILKHSKYHYFFYKSKDLKKFKRLLHYDNPYTVICSVFFVLNNFVFIMQKKGTYIIEIYNICQNKIIKKIGKKDGLCIEPNSCYIQPFIPYPLLVHDNELVFQNMSYSKYGKLFSLKFDIDNNVNLSELNINNKKQQAYNNICNEKTLFLKNNSVMMTILYEKGTQLKNRKCLVYGYGSYGSIYESSYNMNKFLTLCKMGFIVVITHVSGDGKLGFKQYYNGMLKNKNNSFDDFIYICDYLTREKISSPNKMAIWGRSAGGLLIGSIINKRPDLCKLAIMGVPFLTPLLTMGSPKNPLGFESHSEWGDPRNPANYENIKSYSPIENIQACKKYPNIFIYSNLNDTLTPYKETMKYYNLMKEVDVFKNKERDLLIFMDDKFGHKQGTKFNDHNYIYSLVFNMLNKYLE